MHNKDWRINAVLELAQDAYVPWDGTVLKKGAVGNTTSTVKLSKKKYLNVPVPNATAICLKVSFECFKNAKEIRINNGFDKSIKKEVYFKSDKDAIDYIELMFESVIMAFTALEAFANEHIPDDFEIWENKNSKIIVERKGKQEIERFSSTMDKFDRLLPKVMDIDSPKGKKCWQDLRSLKVIRDRIIHMKSDDRRSSGHDVSTIWNSVFKLEPPYKQALSIMQYFIDSMDEAPRWYKLCEFKNL